MISPEEEAKMYPIHENLPTREELTKKKEKELEEAMKKIDLKPSPALANIGVEEKDIAGLVAASYEFAKALIPLFVELELIEK